MVRLRHPREACPRAGVGRGSSSTPHWISAFESVDFLRVGVAAALVAAVRDEPERGQAPRLRRARDGTRFALVRLSCRHRFSTDPFAGMTVFAGSWPLQPGVSAGRPLGVSGENVCAPRHPLVLRSFATSVSKHEWVPTGAPPRIAAPGRCRASRAAETSPLIVRRALE